jgi:hypothetical protein
MRSNFWSFLFNSVDEEEDHEKNKGRRGGKIIYMASSTWPDQVIQPTASWLPYSCDYEVGPSSQVAWERYTVENNRVDQWEKEDL